MSNTATPPVDPIPIINRRSRSDATHSPLPFRSVIDQRPQSRDHGGIQVDQWTGYGPVKQARGQTDQCIAGRREYRQQELPRLNIPDVASCALLEYAARFYHHQHTEKTDTHCPESYPAHTLAQYWHGQHGDKEWPRESQRGGGRQRQRRQRQVESSFVPVSAPRHAATQAASDGGPSARLAGLLIFALLSRSTRARSDSAGYRRDCASRQSGISGTHRPAV